jgi:hypothetical protein
MGINLLNNPKHFLLPLYLQLYFSVLTLYYNNYKDLTYTSYNLSLTKLVSKYSNDVSIYIATKDRV